MGWAIDSVDIGEIKKNMHNVVYNARLLGYKEHKKEIKFRRAKLDAIV